MNAWHRQAVDPVSDGPLEVPRRSRSRRRRSAVLLATVAVGSAVLVASPASAAVIPVPAPGQDEYATDEDTVLLVDAPGVLANYIVDGADPTVTFSSLTVMSSAGNNSGELGTLTPKGGGGFEYAPGPDFYGIVTFTYVVSDGSDSSGSGTVTITVNPVNDGAPEGTPDAYSMVEGSVLSIPRPGAPSVPASDPAYNERLLANDQDVDADVLSASIGSSVSPDHVDPAHGVVSIDVDGSFVYEPEPGFSGVDAFTYDVSDGTVTDTGILVTITVRPVPTTTVTSGPAINSNSSTATFAISSNYGAPVIECSLDGSAFIACSSPVSLIGLVDGQHAFAVRASTPEGIVDATPAVWVWTVDTVVPVLTLTSPTNGSVFTQGDHVIATATCVDGAVSLAPVLGDVATATVGASLPYEATCTDAAGNVATATASYDVIAPQAADQSFEVRWRAAGTRDAVGSAPSSLNGARVSGRIRLVLTDVVGIPVGRDRAIRSVSFRIVDAAGDMVIEGRNHWSWFALGRHRRGAVIDTSRLINGAYRLESEVVTGDGLSASVTATFEVANAPRHDRHRGWGRDCD